MSMESESKRFTDLLSNIACRKNLEISAYEDVVQWLKDACLRRSGVVDKATAELICDEIDRELMPGPEAMHLYFHRPYFDALSLDEAFSKYVGLLMTGPKVALKSPVGVGAKRVLKLMDKHGLLPTVIYE